MLKIIGTLIGPEFVARGCKVWWTCGFEAQRGGIIPQGCLLFIVDPESKARDSLKELSYGWLLGERYVHQRKNMCTEPDICANQNLCSLSSTTLVFVYAFGANEDPTPPPPQRLDDDLYIHLPSIALTGSPALFNFLIASFVLGNLI